MIPYEIDKTEILNSINFIEKQVTSIKYNIINKLYSFIIYKVYNDLKQKIKFSIVMTTHNRKKQTLYTLNSIQRQNVNENIEVILVDDSDSDNNLSESELKTYNFKIIYIIIDNKLKTWTNPCVNYNIGFQEIHGEIVIIQNAEIYHIGNVINTINNIINETNYIVFDVLSLPSYEGNENFYININNNNNIYDYLINKNYIWYQHSNTNNRNFHFLTAITEKNLKNINWFDFDYSLGYCFDDNDFYEKIKNFKLKTININSNIYKILGVHQYHTVFKNITVLHNLNHKIYLYKHLLIKSQFTYNNINYNHNIKLSDESTIGCIRKIVENNNYKLNNWVNIENKIFIDIGANRGVASIILAKQNPKSIIYSFEPDKDVFKILENNIQLNNLNNIKLFNCAVVNSNIDSIVLTMCHKFSGGNTTFSNKEKFNTQSIRSYEVKYTIR